MAYQTSLLAHAHVHAASFDWDQVAQRALAAIEERRFALFAQATKKNAGGIGMAEAISELASINSLSKPSDDDILKVASALFNNGKLSWPHLQPQALETSPVDHVFNINVRGVI